MIDKFWRDCVKCSAALIMCMFAVCTLVASAPAAPAKAKPAAQKPAAATDGQPRVIEQRGKFVIRPDTLFCGGAKVDPKLQKVLGPYYEGPNLNGRLLREKLKQVGQSDYIGGAKRARYAKDPVNCPDNGQNIFITGRTMMTSPVIYPYLKDDPRYPYSLELEARQGAGKNAAFVKVAVARADGFRPGAAPRIGGVVRNGQPESFPEGYLSQLALQQSIAMDARELSPLLVAELFKK
jgi:hypothetical protein